MRNNPLNVKQGRVPWMGSTGRDSRGHALFSGAQFGIRAAVRTLAQKSRNGKNSLIEVISDWAPITDTIGSLPGNALNNPDEYAAFVAARIGVGSQEDLAIFCQDGRIPIDGVPRLVRLILAMSIFENGHDYRLSAGDILIGIGMYLNDFTEVKNDGNA